MPDEARSPEPDDPLPAAPQWAEPVPESNLSLRPVTPVLDPWRRMFDCGDEDINKIIRKATWYEGPRSPVRAIQFGTEDAVVGYVLMGLNRLEHPTQSSRAKKLYLYLDLMSVSVSFRGPAPGARPNERYSDVILRHVVEVMAPMYPKIVGLYAITREDNQPARELLERAHFVLDADPGFRDAMTGAESVLYRLLAPAAASA
jgi:hypothetical protein